MTETLRRLSLRPTALVLVLTFSAAVLALSVALPGASSAQTFRGGISGSITDKSGASIPGATVIATNDATNVSYKSVASSAGEFSFANLPLGSYTLLITSQGFSTGKYDQVNVIAGAPYNIAAKLVVSSATQTVEVTAGALSLDTVSDLQATVLPELIVQNIPNSGRDFTQMLSQTTGFAGLSTGGGAGVASVNGTRSNAVNWQIEGTDNNDLWWNIPAVNQGGVSAIAGVVFPIDSIENFSFVTSGSAALGRNPGGTANLTIKSGSNKLHGSVYYSNHNEFFEATNPFLISTNSRKAASRLQDYGFSVGGPILKDRFFFFLGGERQTFLIGAESAATEPTTAYQTDAYALLDFYGIPHNAVTANLVNGTATAPGLWPSSVINCPTVNSGCDSQDNYRASGNLTGHSNNGVLKLTGKLSQKDTLAVVGFLAQGTQTAPTSSALTPYFENAPIHVENYSIIYNRLVSSTIANQLSAGVSYFNQVFSDYNTNYNLGALGLNTGVTDPGLAGAPHVIIGGSSGVGLTATNTGFDPTGPTAPSGRQDITGHVDDDLAWTKGRHQVHFGGEFRKAQVYDFYQTGQRGTLNFDGSEGPWNAGNYAVGATPSYCALLATKNQGKPYAGAPGISPNANTGLADFLAGCPNTSNSTVVLGDPKRKVFVNTWDVYGQDAWQITPKLSLDLGVRYDYEGPVHSQAADLSVFNPSAPGGLSVATGTNNFGVRNIYNKFYGGISPRVGFAYQVGSSGKTVVRGGYGLYYDTLYIKATLQNNGAQNIPVFGPGLNPAGVKQVITAQANGAVIKPGVDIFPTFAMASGSTGTPPPGSIKISTFDPNFKPANVQIFDLNVQRSIGNAVVAQVGYVGSKGTHLMGLFDINPAKPNVSGSPDTTTRPYYALFPQYGVIDEARSNLGSIYHSLQTSLKTHSYRGLTAQAGYTWSHALDYETGLLPYVPQDPTNERGEYGNSDFDVRNTFTGYVDYLVPGFRGPKRLTHGFEVNTGMSFHQGTPYTVIASGNISGNGESADRAVQVLAHPNAVNHSIIPSADRSSASVQWFDAAAFVDPAPGTYSPTRRGQNYNPGYSAVDIALIKNTPFTERVGSQFKINMYNAFNRTNLAPVGFPVSGESGTIGSTLGPFLGNPTIGPGEPFNVEFALKVLF